MMNIQIYNKNFILYKLAGIGTFLFLVLNNQTLYSIFELK